MTEWDISEDLMAMLRGYIQPVVTSEPLRQVLTHDFPKESSTLPISGGWGYTRADAITFVRDKFAVPAAPDFVALEYYLLRR